MFFRIHVNLQHEKIESCDVNLNLFFKTHLKSHLVPSDILLSFIPSS